MYSWWQCLLVFCAISLSDTHREHSFSKDSLNFQTDWEKSNSKTLLKLLLSPDKQHPITQIPFWKLDAVSDALTSSPVSDQFSPLPKAYKWDNGRLVKREVEKTDAFMIAFRAAIKEAVKEYLAENKVFSDSFQREGLRSGANDNAGQLPSDVEVNFLKRILSKDMSTEPVHRIEPFLTNVTPELAQALQMQPVEEKFYTSEPAGTYSVTLNAQLLSKLQTKRPGAVTTSTSGTTRNVPYLTSAKKSKTSKITVPVSSSKTSVRPLESSDSQSSEKQENLNLVTKNPFIGVTGPILESASLENNWISSSESSDENLDSTAMSSTGIYPSNAGLVTNLVTKNPFIGVTGPILESASLENNWLSSSESSDENLDSTAMPSTGIYPSNAGLVMGIMTADLFTSNREIASLEHFSSPIQHYTPQNDQTSSPESSFSTHSKLSDAYQITSSKEKLVPSLKMETTTMTGIVTSVMPIESDFAKTHIYTPQSTDYTIFETSGSEEEALNTPRTPDDLTLSSEELFSSTKGNPSTDATYFETASEELSTVTPLLIMGRENSDCILKVPNTTTPLQESFTEQTPYENPNSGSSMISPTELPSSAIFPQFTDSYSTEPVEVSSILPLHIMGHTPFPESTKLDSLFTDVFSASREPSDFLETATNSEIFNDAINVNTKSNHMTSNVTSTRPAFLSDLFNDLIFISWKSSSPPIQKVRSAARQNAETRQGHSTSHSPATPSTTHGNVSVLGHVTSVKPSLTTAQAFQSVTTPKIWTHSSVEPSKSAPFTTSPRSTTIGFTPSIHAKTSVTAANPEDHKLSTMSPKSSISFSSTYMSSRSQTIPKTTNIKSASTQSVTTPKIWTHSSVEPSKSAPFTTSPRSTTIGFTPSIHAKTSVTAANPEDHKLSKSSISFSSTYMSSRSQTITKITNTKSAAFQSVTTPKIWTHSSVEPSKSAPFTTSPRSTTIGFTPSIHAKTSVTAANPQDHKLSTMSPKSSISFSSTYMSSRSQTITKITNTKSAAFQSVTTPKIWTHSSVEPSKSVPFTLSQSSTTTGFPPSRPFSDVVPPKSTSRAFTSNFTTSYVVLQKSDTTGAPTGNKERGLTVTKRKRSTTTPELTLSSKAMQSLTSGKSSISGSVSSTSTLKLPYTTLKYKTKEVTRTSSKTFKETTETPAFKVMPEGSDAVPTKLTSISPDILKTPQTTLYSTTAVVAMPLTFHLTGISYSDQLNDNTTEEYKNLEKEVMLVLKKMFSTKYQQDFVQVKILGFSKGSVVVCSEVLLDSSSSARSSSDIVRTVLSDPTKDNFFQWKINASTVESDGITPNTLEPLSLSISFVVLHFGFIAISQNQEKQNYLKGLQNDILSTVNKTFQVNNISFLQVRDLYGDLDVRGILSLKTSTFTNVDVLLTTLLPLANESLDLRSITVEGMHTDLKVYPFNIRITNLQFAVSLLNMASPESQKLSKDLSNVIGLALRDQSLLQVVVREFYSGSVACKGDLIYRFPAPGSGEVLRLFLLALGSDGTLGSSEFKVDLKSITIDEATSTPYNDYIDFPGYAVAIIVMCGLSILIFPLLIFVCYKTQMLGHRKKATIRHRHDPDQQSRRFEMDNRAFRASIEQP